MDVCRACGLAQLADDDTVTDEPRGVEPQALKDQAEAAIERVAAAGWLRGDTVLEFGSPHGGTWIPLLTERGFTTVDVAGGRGAGLFRHHARTRPAERLRAARPGHRPGRGAAAAVPLDRHDRRAGSVECVAARAFRVLLADHADAAARRGRNADRHRMGVRPVRRNGVARSRTRRRPNPTNLCSASSRPRMRWASPSPAAIGRLQRSADRHVESLRSWLEEEAEAGRTVLAYGAASRAVALFSRAGLDSRLLAAVADASPAKQGRRMPGTDIPIVSPDELLAAKPDRVLLTLPDLLPEVSCMFSRARRSVEGRRPVTLLLRFTRKAGTRSDNSSLQPRHHR